MFNFLKRLFNFNTKCNCKCCNHQNNINQIYDRCGFQIKIPLDIATKLDKDGYCVSITKYKGNPSCVQLSKTINGKTKYMGTLKTFMNVKSFKDNNVCNFSKENLIYNEEK